jgi:L-erythro-3,5-diaminohexanoate dehydrogenase
MLAALDISSVIPQIERALSLVAEARARHSQGPEPIRILVLGCGKAGMTALFAIPEIFRDLRKKHTALPVLEILATDSQPAPLRLAVQCGLIHESKCADARNAFDVFRFVHEKTEGQLCDLVLNLVNVPGTESTTVLATREVAPRGVVLWFSMATQFDRAALATDSFGKDVIQLIGNGTAERQSERVIDLVRRHPQLLKVLHDETQSTG